MAAEFTALFTGTNLQVLSLGVLGLCALGLWHNWRQRHNRGVRARAGDGDTLEVALATGRRVRVRLADIDAPELDQPLGKASRAALARLVKNKELWLARRGRDVYGRLVCRVLVDGQDVALPLLETGMAYALPGAPYRYRRAQRKARGVRAGVWSLPARTLPWQHRRGLLGWRRWFGARRRRP